MRCGNCGRELQDGVKFCPGCGTPAAPANFSSPVEPPAVSFGDAPRAPLSGIGTAQAGKKSGCGKVLLILLGVGLLLVVGLAVAGYFGFKYAEDKLKSSAAYALAVKTLKESPEAAERLGEVRETGFPLGAFNESADGTGSAAFVMSVKGSKASGQYDVNLARRGGRWEMRTGRVTTAGGDAFVIWPAGGADGLPPPPVGGADDASPPSAGDDDTSPPPPTGTGAVISGGVINGKAVSKPAPAYPAVARAARAAGVVTVEVVVDEKGRVASARAVSGHPLLRASAEAAARQARFSPTLLSGHPVKVRGVLTYNFEAPPPQ
ncbi:MAG: TonB family protein [Acidobacteria bacterium]|nr:TonB family protein [Acidobacteriota bacterium]